MSASGGSLAYSTYLDAANDYTYDYGTAIEVGADGSAYVAGNTWSTNFPTATPVQASNAGVYDAFVTKLSPSGSALAYSTFLGGSDDDEGFGIADPQIGDMPAASIVKLLQLKPPHQVSDEMLVLADVAEKAREQVAVFVNHVLLKHLPRERAATLAVTLSEGRWTHDFPITVDMVKEFGLPVSTDMPPLIYGLMDLYPQSDQERPSVMYVPLRRVPAAGPGDLSGPESEGSK
jgi:hypothetical protein